jgi:hypothetical protein
MMLCRQQVDRPSHGKGIDSRFDTPGLCQQHLFKTRTRTTAVRMPCSPAFRDTSRSAHQQSPTFDAKQASTVYDGDRTCLFSLQDAVNIGLFIYVDQLPQQRHSSALLSQRTICLRNSVQRTVKWRAPISARSRRDCDAVLCLRLQGIPHRQHEHDQIRAP